MNSRKSLTSRLCFLSVPYCGDTAIFNYSTTNGVNRDIFVWNIETSRFVVGSGGSVVKSSHLIIRFEPGASVLLLMPLCGAVT